MLTRAPGRAVLAPRLGAAVGLVCAFAGLVVLGLEPFGPAPPGEATDSLWFGFNGALIAAAPVAAVIATYWSALAVPVADYGVSDGGRLAGGRALTCVVAIMVVMLPTAEYSRGNGLVGASMSLASAVALAVFLELQRQLRPPADGAVDPNLSGLVVQWDLAWAGSVVAGIAWGIAAATADPAWASMGVASSVATIWLAYWPTLAALARHGSSTPWLFVAAAAGVAIAAETGSSPWVMSASTAAFLFAAAILERDRRAWREHTAEDSG